MKLTEEDRKRLLEYRDRLETKELPYRRRQLELAAHPERRQKGSNLAEALDRLGRVGLELGWGLHSTPEERIDPPPTEKLQSPEDILRDELKRQDTIRRWQDAVTECDRVIVAIDEVLDSGEWNPELDG